MNAFLRDHFFRLTFHDDFSTGETDDLVGKIDRLVDVMKDHNDGHAKFPVQLPHKLQNLDLISDIQICSRLIQKKDLGSLCKRHGDPHTLALSAGKSG